MSLRRHGTVGGNAEALANDLHPTYSKIRIQSSPQNQSESERSKESENRSKKAPKINFEQPILLPEDAIPPKFAYKTNYFTNQVHFCQHLKHNRNGEVGRSETVQRACFAVTTNAVEGETQQRPQT
jgi:hypothetical protein